MAYGLVLRTGNLCQWELKSRTGFRHNDRNTLCHIFASPHQLHAGTILDLGPFVLLLCTYAALFDPEA
jgi:hypothetical protein